MPPRFLTAVFPHAFLAQECATQTNTQTAKPHGEVHACRILGHTHTRTTKQAPPSRRPHAAAHAEARSHTRTHRAIAIQGNPPRWPEASVNTRSSHTCLQVYSGCPLQAGASTCPRPQLDPNPIRAHSTPTQYGRMYCASAQAWAVDKQLQVRKPVHMHKYAISITNPLDNRVAVSISRESLSTHA